MSERLDLNEKLDGETFRSYYYLKKELVDFCRENNLPVSGGKVELTDRIACFLDTGKALETSVKRKATIDLVPIPGTRKLERLKENACASDILLTSEEVKKIDAMLEKIPMSEVFGGTKVTE